jgi:hypothetical protein
MSTMRLPVHESDGANRSTIQKAYVELGRFRTVVLACSLSQQRLFPNAHVYVFEATTLDYCRKLRSGRNSRYWVLDSLTTEHL